MTSVRLSKLPKPNRTAMWALTYRCNLNCKYCFLNSPDASYSKSLAEASIFQINNVLESLKNSIKWKPEIIWITGGEPTLHNQFDYIIRNRSQGIIFASCLRELLTRLNRGFAL